MAYLNVLGDVRRRMQHEGCISLELYEQHRGGVVPRHGGGLVVQAPADEGLAQIRQRLALHTDLW